MCSSLSSYSSVGATGIPCGVPQGSNISHTQIHAYPHHVPPIGPNGNNIQQLTTVEAFLAFRRSLSLKDGKKVSNIYFSFQLGYYIFLTNLLFFILLTFKENPKVLKTS